MALPPIRRRRAMRRKITDHENGAAKADLVDVPERDGAERGACK
jgi:hypothetical protein